MQEKRESAKESLVEKDERTAAGDIDKEQPVCDGEYYYDDAHGYEDFDPDAADEDENK